jgi:hypothetical protein
VVLACPTFVLESNIDSKEGLCPDTCVVGASDRDLSDGNRDPAGAASRREAAVSVKVMSTG